MRFAGMSTWENVTIVGVGLIGGSIGLAIQARGLAKNVIGVGRRASSLERARRCGTVTQTSLEIADAVAEADLVLVCTPVAHVAETVVAVARHCRRQALITDAGSTKQGIVDDVKRLWPGGPAQFVGSHPLAGSEKAGPEHASANLLDGRTVIVTADPGQPESTIEATTQFWQRIGAVVRIMSPEEHDRALASVSHLPHIVASALAACTPTEYLDLVATGWLDTTRIAAGEVPLWSQILEANREHVIRALDGYREQIQQFQSALESNRRDDWEEYLTSGKERRDSLGN